MQASVHGQALPEAALPAIWREKRGAGLGLHSPPASSWPLACCVRRLSPSPTPPGPLLPPRADTKEGLGTGAEGKDSCEGARPCGPAVPEAMPPAEVQLSLEILTCHSVLKHPGTGSCAG